jgi:hypothetical protein
LKILAPIVLFVYNRLEHTIKTVEALKKNKLAKDSELFIYSDAPKENTDSKEVYKVREYIKGINGFKKVIVITRDKNFGLANSIIDGVTTVINKYNKVIVLEDDLVTSPYFIKYMNESLQFYKNSNDILSITGYSFSTEIMDFPKSFEKDIYLHIRPMSWSWATWKNRWSNVIWNMNYFDKFISNSKEINSFNEGGKDLTLMLLDQKAGLIDSWYIRWAYHAFKTHQYTIYPKYSLISNLGFDNSGVHGKSTTNKLFSQDILKDKSNWILEKDITFNRKIIKNFNKIFAPSVRTQISLKIRLFFKIDKRLKA